MVALLPSSSADTLKPTFKFENCYGETSQRAHEQWLRKRGERSWPTLPRRAPPHRAFRKPQRKVASTKLSAKGLIDDYRRKLKEEEERKEWERLEAERLLAEAQLQPAKRGILSRGRTKQRSNTDGKSLGPSEPASPMPGTPNRAATDPTPEKSTMEV